MTPVIVVYKNKYWMRVAHGQSEFIQSIIEDPLYSIREKLVTQVADELILYVNIDAPTQLTEPVLKEIQ